MADDQFAAQTTAPQGENAGAPAGAGDMISLNDALKEPLEHGPGSSSQDSILNAAEIFQQQLEQMTTWKHQLAQQMELMRRDGIKLLERQKNLAAEKKALADDRQKLAGDHEQIQKLHAELDAQSQRLSQRATEIDQAQQQLTTAHREQGERELLAKQKGLADQEARHLAEDIRLREGLEQCESQRQQLAEARRQVEQERESLAGRARDLDARDHAIQEHHNAVTGREQAVAALRQQLEQAQAALHAREQELSQKESAVQNHLAELQLAQQKLHDEHEAAQKHRHELQRKLEAVEGEHAEQLETLAKQTKRLSERRAELETAEADLEKALATRIAAATQSLKDQLTQAQAAHQEKVRALEQSLAQADTLARSWQGREANFQRDLGEAVGQLNRLREELKGAMGSVERVSTERAALAQQLAAQVEASRHEAAKWQQMIQDASSQSAGSGEALSESKARAEAAQKELDATKQKLAQLQSAKDELEFQIEVRAEDNARALEAAKQELTQQIAQRDQQIQELAQKLEAAEKAGPTLKLSGKESQKVKEIAKQMQMLEGQRNDLASQLFAAQDSLKKLQEESLLAKNALESQLLSLQQKTAALESEKHSWQKQKSANPIPATPETLAQSQKQAAFHRHRLLRQAKALRQVRVQIRDTQVAVEQGREEITQQRELIRARKENLEQVKRLLEKQEMVMARKLADHNAFKTVAAVGIFVIMVLGSAFFGVNHFVHPLYRSEAVVQLAAPQDLHGAELESWMNKQMEAVRSNDVTFAAWKVLHSGDTHYTLQDVRDEWIATLPRSLQLSVDSHAKTLTLRYFGGEAENVADASNALARAFLQPDLRDPDSSKDIGAGAQLAQKATVPAIPVEDNRLMICLSIVAGALLLSLVFVLIFRHFVARQLKEIDQMADTQDLEDIKTEMPEGVKPAVE